MASTVPFPFTDHLPPPSDALPDRDDWTRKLHTLIEDYTLALGDVDKATSPEDAGYHEGRLDALEQTLVLLLDVPLEAWGAHHSR